jgi:hypothetical protein
MTLRSQEKSKTGLEGDGGAAKRRALEGAEIYKPALSAFLNEASSDIERFQMIVAMQQFVFDHYLEDSDNKDRALERLHAMYRGHIDRRSIQ